MRCPHCGSTDIVRCNRNWNWKHGDTCPEDGDNCFRSTWKCFPKQHTWEVWDCEDNEY